MRGLSSGEPADDPGADAPGVIARLLDNTPLDRRGRAALLRRLGLSLGASARRAGAAAVASGQWLTDTVAELAPHVPIRDLPTLSAHHGGLLGDELASALTDSAVRTTSAIGAAAGVVSSLEFAAPPLLLSSPVQVAAETVAVIAVELKLVAELHEVYGRAATGTPAVRAAAYLGAWTRGRALERAAGGGGVSGLLTGATRRALRRRVMKRAGENAASVLPMLAGALASASLNARQTRRLGAAITQDLHP
ncbi:MAG TPA: hypothetical protein VG899_03705 [Mycobacteriales bacterium]|nr:hypothetical protein [Mycobacteriales bacterium]HWA65460.1 hypothetical protein [Mycobacteriales bacterium]